MSEHKSHLTAGICGLIILICLTFANQIVRAQSLDGYVVAGERFDGITIGTSTADDVISLYGKDYKLIDHKGYSFEMIYKDLGLGFYYCQGDPKKQIFVVEIEPPSRAVTDKGIILGLSTIGDVFNLYGKTSRSSQGYQYPGINFDFEVETHEEDQEDARSARPAAENEDQESGEPGLKIDPKSDGRKGTAKTVEKSSAPNLLETVTLNNPAPPKPVTPDQRPSAEMEDVTKKVVKLIELVEKNGLRQCNDYKVKIKRKK